MVQAILSNSEEDKIVAGLTKLITNKRPTCRSIVILELLTKVSQVKIHKRDLT